METVNISVVDSSDARAVEDCVFGWYKNQGDKGPVIMPLQGTSIDVRVLLIRVPRAVLFLATEGGIKFEVHPS